MGGCMTKLNMFMSLSLNRFLSALSSSLSFNLSALSSSLSFNVAASSRAQLSLSASRTLLYASLRLFADTAAVCSCRNEWSIIFVVSVFVVVSSVGIGFD